MKRKWLVIGIILLFIGTTVIPSSGQNIEKLSLRTSRGNTLYVGGSGPGNYSKIQDAINASSDGDTIFVYNGTYDEHITINKAIHLIGQVVSSTIIDGQNTGCVITVSASATITRFTIQNSGSIYGYEAGVISNSQPDMSYIITVTGNCFKNNYNGVLIQDSQNDVITGNTFMNNDCGVFLFLSSNCRINNNNFINNTNHSFFRFFIGFQKHPRNNWTGNYWDDWHSSLPRPIRGTNELILFVLRPGAVYTLPFPWFNIDWHPAKEPYNIPGMSQ